MNGKAFYSYLSDELFHMTDEWLATKDYHLLIDRLMMVEKERNPISLVNTIVFEGERCSGKDTLIERICQKNDGVTSLPRVSDNAAWQRLCIMKKNCYFSVDDYISGVLLWFSDLSYRLTQWLKYSPLQPILINRYIDSLVIIQNSLLKREETDIAVKSYLLKTLEKMFPRPSVTFVLDIDIETLLLRMKNCRNRLLSKDEISIANDNLAAFRSLNSKEHIHINACMPIDLVTNAVLAYIHADERWKIF